MATYNADIRIGVKNSSELTKLERKFEKINRVQNQIKASANTVLGVEKQIIAQKRALLTLEGKARTQGRERLKVLQLQKQELNLQKKELQQIVNLEKKAALESAKASRTKKSSGRNLRAAGAGAGIAAVGIPGLGGVTGGGLAGFAIGGLKGAAIGAATAGLVELTAALVAFGAKSAVVAAEVNKLQLALKNVTGGGNEFKEALAAIRGVVDDFNTPLNDATAQFTKLTAAGKASGFTIQELEQVYRGLSAANKALGGNSERLQGILLATIQVFSKGKVQAEELRGQIGERLSGAFAKFAKSAGLTTSQLDKALEKGEVSLEDFVRFAQSLLVEYEEDAKVIADSPAEAGERLKKAMTDLNVAVGGELANLGAKFQDFATQAITALQRVLDFLGQTGRQLESFAGGLPADKLEAATERLKRATSNLAKARDNLRIAQDNKEKFGGTAFDEDIRRAEQGIKIFTQFQKDAQKIIDGFKLGPFPTTKPPVPDGDGDGSNSNKPTAEEKAAARRAAAAEKRLRIAEKAVFTQKELNRLAADLAVAELQGNKELAIRLRGIRDEIGIRERLFTQLENEEDARVKARLNTKALLDIEQIRIRVGQQLAEQQKIAAEELQEQRDLLLEMAGYSRTIADQVERINGDPLQDLTSELRDLQRVRDFGRNADLASQVEDLVINQGVPFNEAFDLAEQVAQQRQLNEATLEYNNLLNNIGNTFTNGLVEGLTLAITETDKLGESMRKLASDILGAIGQALILKSIKGGVNALGGTDGVGLFSILSSTFGFAQGGFVTSPTQATVGEGGSDEYIIPAQKMSSAMERYNSGARGEAVVNGADGSGGGGGGVALAEAPTSINIEGGVMQFNDTNYIRQDQVPAIINQASKQGEARALRRLQMSPAARRKAGL